MAFVRITKTFTFEAAHFLHKYNGPCSNIHGHSYKMEVCIGGVPKAQINDPEDGLLLDFKKLKQIVHTEIIEKFDHALIINSNANIKTPEFKNIVLPFQPTCENMVIYFSESIKENLPEEIKLLSIKLWETSSSFAEWQESDNKDSD